MAQPESGTTDGPPRRPNIAREMTMVIAAAEHVTTLSRRAHPSLRDAVDAVTAALTRVATTVSDQSHAPESIDVASAILAELVPAGPSRADRRDGVRRAALAASASFIPRPLDDVITDAVARGIDGEALCWALIMLETTHHTKLIWLQANRIVRSIPHVNPSDLLGWGWQGLRLALRHYDPTHYAFSTYACTRINGAIRDGIRREGPVPKRLTTYVRRVSAAEDVLAQRLGRAPSLVEVAEHLDSTLDQLRVAARCAPVVSLDARLAVNPVEDPRWSDDPSDPADQATASAWREAFSDALTRLPADEADAVRRLIVEEQPLALAAEQTGVSTRQLRQRAQRGRERLAESLEAWHHLVAT